MWGVSRLALCALLALGVLNSGAVALPPPAGSEFQINTYTQETQASPAAAMEDDGDFVVVWDSVQDGGLEGVFVRRFAKGGAAQGVELQVNTYTTGDQSNAAVAMDAEGDFVVVWTSPQDGQDTGVFAQRFGSSGARLGSEFQVNAHTASVQSRVDVAMRDNGDFVVVWNSYGQDGDNGVFGRRFDAGGTAQGVEFQVNSFTPGRQYAPDIAMADDGRFVVVWSSADGQDGELFGVFGQRFNAGAVPQGAEFQVNTYTPSYQFAPAAAMRSDGSFVVAWSSYHEGSADGMFGQRFDSAGGRLGVEFQINSHTLSYQEFGSLAVDANGDFLVAWNSIDQDGSGRGVFAQGFSSAGAPVGAEIQVHSYLTGDQAFPSVAAAGGAFVVAWASLGQDGSEQGVFAQRFGTALATIDVDGDGQVDALTDTLLMLRYVFGFRGATLVTGAVDLANCTRCTAAQIEAYIATLD